MEPAPVTETESGLQLLGRALRPQFSRAQFLAGGLCALLGFALVTQVRLAGRDELATLRQDDLVILLDEVTHRADQLEAEVTRLQGSRDELASGADSDRVALELAQARAESEGILSGRLPAQGVGLHIDIDDPAGTLQAAHLYNLLEELRNAGAEVAQVNGVRLVTTSSFIDVGGAIVVDGTALVAPYRWAVIGDPATLDRAIEIHGGALPTIRREGGIAATTRAELVTVDATVALTNPAFARPLETNGD